VDSVTALSEKYGFEFGGVAGWEYFSSLPGYSDEEPWQWSKLMADSMAALKARKAAYLANKQKPIRKSRFWG